MREEERERNINVWLPLVHPLIGDLACNPGMRPDWESNQRPFGYRWALSPLSHTSQGEVLVFKGQTLSSFNTVSLIGKIHILHEHWYGDT